jgi:hypothetical protein
VRGGDDAGRPARALADVLRGVVPEAAGEAAGEAGGVKLPDVADLLTLELHRAAEIRLYEVIPVFLTLSLVRDRDDVAVGCAPVVVVSLN